MKRRDIEHYLLKYVIRLVISESSRYQNLLDCENIDSLASPGICSRDQEICIFSEQSCDF